MTLLNLILLVSISVVAYTVLYLGLSSFLRKRLFQKLFPHTRQESELSKEELGVLDDAQIDTEKHGAMYLFGMAYLIVNMPGVALCNTFYRMDKAGVPGYVVMIASAIVYSAIISLIYLYWFVRSSH